VEAGWTCPENVETHPIGKVRAIEIDALAAIDLGLPVERKVIGIFADQHMGDGGPGSDKRMFFQPLLGHHQPGAVPVEQLQPISFLRAEHEDSAKLRLGPCGTATKAATSLTCRAFMLLLA
jgi:hypothetical protein